VFSLTDPEQTPDCPRATTELFPYVILFCRELSTASQ